MIEIRAIQNVRTTVGKVEAFALSSNRFLLATPTAFLFQKTKQLNSPKSVRNYAQDLKKLYVYLLTKFRHKYEDKGGDDCQVTAVQNELYRELDSDSASKFFEGLKNGTYGGEPLSSKSLQRIEATIMGFYKFCFETGLTDEQLVRKIYYTDRDATLTVTKGITTNLSDQYYSEKEFNRVILGSVPGKNSFIKSRDRLSLKLAYGLGLRPHELLRSDNFSKEKLREIISKESVLNNSTNP